MATNKKERAKRMVDFSMKDAAVTFDLGKPVTEEERQDFLEQLREQLGLEAEQ